MNWILRYRKIVLVFIFLLVSTGIFTYYQLPKRDLPEINVNIASITTPFPGATPLDVERTITNPIEDKIKDIEGVDTVESISTTGFSSVTVTLEGNVNNKVTYSKIRQSISDIARTFPEEVQDSSVNTDLNMTAVSSYHLKAQNYDTLYKAHDLIINWQKQLSNISGVQSVQVKGLPEEQLLITLDAEKLNNQSLSPLQIIDSLQKELSPGAIGTIEEDEKLYQLRLNKTSDWKELEDISVGLNPQGESITLNDIGAINLTHTEVKDLITYKEQPSLSLTIKAKEGMNISALQDRIDEEIKSLSGNLPDNITVEQFYSQNTLIEEVFTNLLTSFGISLAAVLLIMMIGLPFSSALLVAIAIPISVLIGLIPLPYVGVDLNQISIIGIIIAIGILVDDAIVVNDNIQRRFQLGDSAWKGTIRGIKDVRLSIITSTLMIVFSFFPLTFLSGSNGDFIRALPTTLIATIVASTILSLTLIPTVLYIRKKRKDSKAEQSKSGLLGSFFSKLEMIYADKILPKVTKRPIIIGFSGLIVCALLASLAIKIPFEFFPSADRKEVTISVTAPQGTTLNQTRSQLEEMESFIKQNSEVVEETAIFAGSGMPPLFSSTLQQSGENTGQILIRVNKSQQSASNFINNWEEKLRNKFTKSEIFLETITAGPPPSAPIAVNIQGPKLEQLIQTANDLKKELIKLDSTELITLNMNNEQPYIEYSLDRAKIAENNISIDQISSQLQVANTGIPLRVFDNGVNRYDMKLLLNDGDGSGVNLEALRVTGSSTSKGTPRVFTLDELIEQEKSNQLGSIPHMDGERTVTVKGYGEESSNSFQKEANEVINEFEKTLPAGYSFTNSGELNAQQEFFIEVSKLFVIVLFLIYLVMAIQFNSLTIPLLITSTVFLAVTGAIIGLFVTNEPLSFLAVLGIVSLSGIVVRNSVILVDFIEQNHRESQSIHTAVIEAGRSRLRPIILTSLTSIAALLPIAFSGDVLFRPLAISIVGGLLFSTILTLILLPSFYLILYRIRRGKIKTS
ncbi:efflux RND transporter permease subunit [Pontibacillus sp. HMF3514]|uniref:efflux RND transporter permease subunit n=1 Tax=Pontibacillus sp. HMF3514 TaxID=2692425 RepID=UPI00131F59DF|nr:efflux RND transporter permease subunit [Pontibacillus sp. HMF3514]QHE52478.1 MMPL family transporter [Pontibacillus sp. HMF3514]